jgi:hypothetical protein
MCPGVGQGNDNPEQAKVWCAMAQFFNWGFWQT